MKGVACRSQNGNGCIQIFFAVKFQAQHTVLGFPVVGNADIFDADSLVGQQGDNVGQGAGFVCDIHIKTEGTLDGTAGSVDKGCLLYTSPSPRDS